MSEPEAMVSAEDVERTSRIVAGAVWGIASIVMVGSMVSGGYAFHDLGEPAVFGVITALAADTALTSWLLISRRLRALGVGSAMGVVLELACGGASAFLNVGAAVFTGGLAPHTAKTMLAIAHSFLPILLILVSLAGGEAHLRLVRLRRERETLERARLAVEQRQREEVEQRRANGELVDAQAVLDAARELRRAAEQETRQAEQDRLEAARVRAETEADIAATRIARDNLATPQPATPVSRPRRRTVKKASAEERRQWVRDRFAETGALPRGPEVDAYFGTTRSGCQTVNAVEAEIAEAKRRALHAVGSQR